MSEQNTDQTTIEQESNLVNPFSEESWMDTSGNVGSEKNDTYSNEQSNQSNQSYQTQQDSNEEIYDANEYLKMKLGFETWDDAASQISELKQKGQIGFENEDSRKFYEYAKENKEEELINFLEQKRKIDKLSTSEIKDANTAAEIVKLSMQQKNKDLDQSEIDFLFNEQFKTPQKPEQKFDELDSEFEERVSVWENRVNEIEKKLVIEAKLARPEIEKIKSSLVLPDLNPSQPSLTQEELAYQQRYMDNYHSEVNNVINSFDGFSVSVKDEGADFTVAYVPSYEEKQAVAEQLSYFANNNMDANLIFAERWVNDDNTINVQQMTKDLFLLQNEGKITQKYVNEAANRRLAMHLKNQSNINVTGSSSYGTFSPDNRQTEMDKLAAIMFAK